MKLYVFNNCCYDAKCMSGTDKRTYEWCKIFKKMDHQIQLFIHRAIFKRYERQGYNITVTSSINYKRWGILLTYLWNALRASILSPKIKSDSVIYSSSDALPDVLPAIVMKLKNREAKWITGLHLIAPNPFKGFKSASTRGFIFPTLEGLYYYLYQKIAIYGIKHLAQLVMVSNNMDKDLLIKRGIRSQKIMVVYGGVNFEEVERAKGEEKYDACFIGRIHPQKGVPDLLDAWSLVCQKKRNAKLAMIGQLDALKREVHKRGLNKNIEFLGYLDGVEKFQILKSSKIFLFPSTYESFGIVVAEAMACGLPVVGYNLPIFKEIYPKGMVKVAIGDRKGLAQEVINLLFNEKRRGTVSEEAKELSTKFNWKQTAETILNYLERPKL